MLKKWRLKSLTLRKNILLPFEEGIFMAVSNGFLCSYLSSKLKLYYHDRIPLNIYFWNLLSQNSPDTAIASGENGKRQGNTDVGV